MLLNHLEACYNLFFSKFYNPAQWSKIMNYSKSAQEELAGAMTFPAVRGIQAKREFYCIMCTFSTIFTHFQFDADPRISPELKAQRKLREARVPNIASYILENSENYIFSSITISVNGKIKFIPAPGKGSDSPVGQIAIPLDAIILVNDGQHRCAAIKAAYEQNPSLANEKISVVVFEDRGLKRSQQMFADLNKHAVKPTKSLGLLYDHRDAYARFIVSLVNDVDVFVGRTEMERTNISNRSVNFFTLNGVADATKQLLKLKTKSISSEKQKLAIDFWTSVAKNIPEWNLLVQKKMSPYDLRKNYVHAHTNILYAIGMVGHILTKNPNWKEKLKGLQKIDWRRDSPIWKDKVVMDGKMLKNRLGIKRAANEILKCLGVDEMVDEVNRK